MFQLRWLGYTNTWPVMIFTIIKGLFIKEHKAFECLKDWGSIRFFILHVSLLSKLSKSKISNFCLPLCMLGKLIEN
jgi:hypothetical protein